MVSIYAASPGREALTLAGVAVAVCDLKELVSVWRGVPVSPSELAPS